MLCSLPPANEVWGKVIILHLFVILFMGVCAWSWGVPGARGCAWSWGCAWSGGCLLPGRVPAPRGVCSWGGGACSEGCLVETPQPATAAGGTHPTGMHSCLLFGSFHNDNSYIQPYLDRTKTFILSSFLMSLDSIIFVHKCPVQCDLVRLPEVFSCMRDWLQKSAK